MPNLIIRFGTCNVRRLNQLGSADLYLGRPAVLFGRACRIQRQKIDFVSYVELFHVPKSNALNKLILPRVLHVYCFCHVHTACFDLLEKNGGRSEKICIPLSSRARNNTCLKWINHFCMRRSVFENERNRQFGGVLWVMLLRVQNKWLLKETDGEHELDEELWCS